MRFVAPDAAFWSEPEQVFVSVLDRSTNPDAWETYVAGLQRCYRGFGAGHLAERQDLDRQRCSMFWLISTTDGQVVGGARAVGPFDDSDTVEDLPVVGELSGSPSQAVLRPALAELLSGGLIEGKGAWSAPGVKGLGPLFGRFLWHCSWWFSTATTVATSGVAQNIEKWRAAGGRPIPGVEPAADFPVPDHHTIPLLVAADRFAQLPSELQDQLHEEWAYLHPARSRAEGRAGSGIEIVVGGDRLQTLRHAGVEIVDHLPELGQEAGRCRSIDPETRRSEEAGPWVHYPWRRTAIRVLGPSEFHAVRTDRNRNKLTSDELRLLRRKKVGVIGLSVGNPIAFGLAQEGLCGHLRLGDFDTVELSNLNRLPGSLFDLGARKTTIAARRIAELDPYLEVEVFEEGVRAANLDRFLDGLDLVIEECDSLDLKILVRQAAGQRGIPVIMETNDGGLLDVERFDLDPDRPPFHGLVGDVDPADLAELTQDEKVPFVLRIIDAEQATTDLAASLVEIDRTISSWPQLASDVALGAALAMTSARHILLGRAGGSGRSRVDLDRLLADPVDPLTTETGTEDRVPARPTVLRRPELDDRFDAAMITAASLAPSGGNMQPWRFVLGQDQDRFEVYAAGETVGMDIGGRGTAVACGAALMNAGCVAAFHGRLGRSRAPGAGGGPGVGPSFDLELDLDRPDLHGTLLLGDGSDDELARLSKHITSRVTNRRLDPTAATLPAAMLAELSSAAEAAGGLVHFVPSADLGDLPDLCAESDRIRFVTSRLHRELFEEIRRPGLDPTDRGLDERTLEMSAADRSKLAVIRRPDVAARLDRWDVGHRLGDDTRSRLRQSAGLLVVSVDGEDRSDYVRGGMALQRLWLEATIQGVGLQPVSPIFGYAKTIEELIEVVGDVRAPQLLDLRHRAFSTIGLGAGESLVLALRAHFGPPPSAISDRAAVVPLVRQASVSAR